MIVDANGGELTGDDLFRLFRDRYFGLGGRIALLSYRHESAEADLIQVQLEVGGQVREIAGRGVGAMAAFVDALERELRVAIGISDYTQHAMAGRTDAAAAAYVEVGVEDTTVWGVAVH